MPYYSSQPDRKPPETPRNRRGALRWVILCVSALLMVYGAARLIIYTAELFSARRTTQELREAAEEAAETAAAEVPALPAGTEAPRAALQTASLPPAAPAETAVPSGKLPEVQYPNGYELNQRIRTLRKKSEYIIGWITMDDLDEPVVYRNNTFFLDHDAMGKRNSNGAIFMNEGTGLLTRPYTILLFGHNMKSGAMFGNLRKYEEFAYCSRHRTLRFDTLYEEGQYAIFSVATISLTPGKSRYINLSAIQSDDRQTRKKALRELENHSVNNMMLDVNEEDQVLLLITCVGDDDERLVVAARRLRDGERPDHLTLKQ